MRRRPTIDPQNPTPEALLDAYRCGIFPMVDPFNSRIEWFSPDPRAVLPLDGFHTPRSLARIVRRADFDIRFDTKFEDVMRCCAAPRAGDDLTWIDERMISLYGRLHEQGHAHSVEAWLDGTLVGGLYGVSIGCGFFGESMFSRPEKGGTNASKVCLVHLVRRLRERGFLLLDTQFWTPHLDQFGCVEIPRRAYLERLARAVRSPERW